MNSLKSLQNEIAGSIPVKHAFPYSKNNFYVMQMTEDLTPGRRFFPVIWPLLAVSVVQHLTEYNVLFGHANLAMTPLYISNQAEGFLSRVSASSVFSSV